MVTESANPVSTGDSRVALPLPPSPSPFLPHRLPPHPTPPPPPIRAGSPPPRSSPQSLDFVLQGASTVPYMSRCARLG